MGGTDVDLALAQSAFMPHFGRNERNGAPAHHYIEALSVHDQNRQRSFSKYNYEHVDPPFGPRLRSLQLTGNTHRTARIVERTKIHLSTHLEKRTSLSYIERGLVVKANSSSLQEASAAFQQRLDQILNMVVTDIGTSPDVVYLTGGMSQSPYIVEILRKRFPQSTRVRGDASFGVVRGLAIHAST